MKENNTIFSADVVTSKELTIREGKKIEDVAKIEYADVPFVKERGERFADDIEKNFIADFEKNADKMVHVSTFCVIDDIIYMTYYANTQTSEEHPSYQTARLVYCSMNNPTEKIFMDIQSVGDDCYGYKVQMVYDTILMKKDSDTLIVMWTAKVNDNYYRFYRTYSFQAKKLGDVKVNRFRVGETENDFSTSGIQNALAENEIFCKKMYSDIGIMQKFTTRVENGKKYYYTGTYSGDFTCVIKSCDFVTWEYVSQPDFYNLSKWENATYVKGNKCYYFVRQQNEEKDGFLTVYDLEKKTWDKPVLIEDCQSRSDFIEYKGALYLVHAPIDREHIGIIQIDEKDIAKSQPILLAHMRSSCFYPFVQYLQDGILGMSYTVNREHIRLASFVLDDYLK